MARKKFVCGNWKMHKTVAESVALVKELKAALVGVAGEVQVAVAPPFTALKPVADALGHGGPIELAAQDVHFEKQGAFTGEVSAPMLADVCCGHCLVGHSERRQLFGETDESVNKKVKALLAAGILPIVCVGETLAQREAGETLAMVGRQVRGGLAGLSAEQIGRLTVAYEPVWAIGTGKTATTAQAQEVHAAIRGLLRELAGGVADSVRIQYGGSVKPENAAELMSQPDVDGALVGGASLKADDFSKIVKGAIR
ncbi:triose-phosphate isomerase [Anaeromyxobacter paludicola]|uniref:Triosephosphate isomerase n=1 Tax=Anaeromyxobacter paludicola TaxID=2918171 RepID=A0ABM7X7L7_9BACT|nr:triose-phosphate isomerase [Anaeromyxobacter paludicola]BDG07823.1 triosephosphate isomerase [Anaeromyxobacter paludicola]